MYKTENSGVFKIKTCKKDVQNENNYVHLKRTKSIYSGKPENMNEKFKFPFIFLILKQTI